MKSTVFLMAVALALPAAVFAQDKMMSAPATGGADAMMRAPAARSADSMMGEPAMDKGAATTADPKVGSMLRSAASTGRKVIFSTLKAARALAAKGPTVLMFAADGSPVSQAALREINAEGSRLGNVTVVVVDYDKAADLKARYGVTYQYAYVRIDAMGRKLAAWSGGGVDGILSHVDRM
jgi:hypothetical protein